MKMIPFDMERLADEFKNTIDWMLEEGEYGEQLRRDLQQFKDNKGDLNQNPDSEKAFRMLIELFVTQAWWFQKPGDFDDEMDSFIDKHGTSFRTPAAQEDLVDLVGRLAPPRIVAWAKENTSELLTEYPTIRKFTEEQYALSDEGKTKVLGEKGRDNYLRDFGHWDRIPIDRQEMRFIIRTGIYHACNIENRNDPLRKSYLHDALTSFCSTYLKGKMVEGIDLSNAPGIVDIFIWSYCSRRRYNICGNTSKCDRCNLEGVCLYALTGSSK